LDGNRLRGVPADAAISPPMKPPPGSLWPRSSTKMENSIIRLVR